MNDKTAHFITIRDLQKCYENQLVLSQIHLDLHAGDHLAILGPSGSGKSTLLHIMGGLDGFDSGEYWLDGEPMREKNPRDLAALRAQKIGFVFQAFHLLPTLNALENVALPLLYQGFSARERRERAHDQLVAIGLADRLYHKPDQLSGGQKQRVAIARALVTKPRLILADEPTGNLDRQTGMQIMALLEESNAQGATLVVITHDPVLANRAKRQVWIQDGQLSDMEK